MKKITLSVAISQIETQQLIIKNLTKKLEDRDCQLKQIKIKELQGSADEKVRVKNAIAMIKKIRAKEAKKMSRIELSEKFKLTLGSINYWCDKISCKEA